MPLEDSVYRTAESIHKIMIFMLYRVPPEKRGRFLSRIRGKVEEMNPVEMAGKRVPINSTIGQAVSVTKNILNGLNPEFVQQVLYQLMIILSHHKGEKKAMLRTAQVDVIIEPFDSAVQNAVRKMKLNPGTSKMLEGVTKVIVHRGLGGGKLGYVESGQGKDPSAIHLFKTPILEQARRQGGGLSGRGLDDAFERALVEVIGHEGAHIQSGAGPQQPFGDEHHAERGGASAVSTLFNANDDRPISRRDEDKRPISKRQASPVIKNMISVDDSKSTLNPTLTPEYTDMSNFQENTVYLIGRNNPFSFDEYYKTKYAPDAIRKYVDTVKNVSDPEEIAILMDDGGDRLESADRLMDFADNIISLEEEAENLGITRDIMRKTDVIHRNVRNILENPISIRQDALDRSDVGYGDNSGQGLTIADPANTRETQIDTQSYEQNAGNTAGGQTDSGAAQGGYGGADSGGSTYGLFSIPIGTSPGAI